MTRLIWGDRVHKAIETRLRTGEPMTGTMAQFEPYAAKMAQAGKRGIMLVEHQVAFTRELQRTEWTADDVWVRGIFDVLIAREKRIGIYDWKTGKRKPQVDQLRLFAVLARALIPLAETFDTAFIWLKAGAVDRETFQAADLDAIQAKFFARADRMAEAIETGCFDPKPSGLCRGWCPVTTCQFYRSR